jgi:hypothetical protein
MPVVRTIRTASEVVFGFIAEIADRVWKHLFLMIILMVGLKFLVFTDHDLWWAVSQALNAAYIISILEVLAGRLVRLRRSGIGRCHRCGKFRKLSMCRVKDKTIRLCEECLYI